MENKESLISKQLMDLPAIEKKILVLYYYEDLTIKEIAEVLEITEEEVIQIHTKTIIYLKTKWKSLSQ